MQALVPVDSLNCRVPRQKAQEGEARKGGLRAQCLTGRAGPRSGVPLTRPKLSSAVVLPSGAAAWGSEQAAFITEGPVCNYDVQTMCLALPREKDKKWRWGEVGQLSDHITGGSQGSGVPSANSESSGHSEGVRSAVLVWPGQSSWGRQHWSWGLQVQGCLDRQTEGRLCRPGGVGSTVTCPNSRGSLEERGEAEGSVWCGCWGRGGLSCTSRCSCFLCHQELC